MLFRSTHRCTEIEEREDSEHVTDLGKHQHTRGQAQGSGKRPSLFLLMLRLLRVLKQCSTEEGRSVRQLSDTSSSCSLRSPIQLVPERERGTRERGTAGERERDMSSHCSHYVSTHMCQAPVLVGQNTADFSILPY